MMWRKGSQERDMEEEALRASTIDDFATPQRRHRL